MREEREIHSPTEENVVRLPRRRVQTHDWLGCLLSNGLLAVSGEFGVPLHPECQGVVRTGSVQEVCSALLARLANCVPAISRLLCLRVDLGAPRPYSKSGLAGAVRF